MSWETINYACGHKGQEQMYGRGDARRARAAAMGQHECPACRAAKAAAEADAAGLPALKGTPKQVSWASDLRATAMAELDKCLAQAAAELAKATPDQAAQWASANDAVQAKAAAIRAQAKASWWIDNARVSGTIRSMLLAAGKAAMGK